MCKVALIRVAFVCKVALIRGAFCVVGSFN